MKRTAVIAWLATAGRLRLLGLALLLVATAPVAEAQEVPGCGSLRNAFGPFDYRDPVARGESLRVVEAFHFTAEVASLQKGRSGSIAGDLDYTLRAFPNHHQALASMLRYVLASNSAAREVAAVRPPICYFRRAIVFAPDDEFARVIYGNFLQRSGEVRAAQEQYEEALRLAPRSAEINYNAGLFFVGIGDIVRAKSLAEVAYGEGHPLPGLRQRIAAAEKGAELR